jgi:hypothetical protein
MNYLKIYCNLIRKAENRTSPEGYTEKHHTFPKSIFGKNDRLVVLTAREHYIAHALLEKAFIKRYGLKHWKTIKMTYAFWGMNTADKCKTRYKNSHIYSSLRSRYISNKKGFKMSEQQKIKLSKCHKGKIPWNKGKSHSEETIFKMRKNSYKRTEQHISKLEECRKVYVYEIISPDNQKFIVDSMKKFCYNNPQYGIDRSAMNRVGRGKQKAHKGWKVSIIKKL